MTMNYDIRSCARCGGDHDDIAFKMFARPAGEISHWAMCPKTNEPLLLKVIMPGSARKNVDAQPTANVPTGDPQK